jgi:hypothetical protein
MIVHQLKKEGYRIGQNRSNMDRVERRFDNPYQAYKESRQSSSSAFSSQEISQFKRDHVVEKFGRVPSIVQSPARSEFVDERTETEKTSNVISKPPLPPQKSPRPVPAAELPDAVNFVSVRLNICNVFQNFI